jgi:molybdenum cofactor synthesis domain-containing protein
VIAVARDLPPAAALAAWLALLADRGALDTQPERDAPLADALGAVAARDVVALHAHPPHRCAAMDGIAVRAPSTAGAPVVLRTGEYAAIDTGEPVGAGWDAVVPVEETAPAPDGMLVRHPAAPGAHVRPAGEDVPAGAAVLAAGARLRPYDLGLAAACGHATVAVRVPVGVAVVPTGDELRPAGTVPEPGETADSNSVMLAARLREEGATVHVGPIVRDDPAELEAALRAGAATHRVVLLLAGSSKGRRDHAADVVGRCGVLAVHGVALRPAHPVILGAVGTSAVVGVPGYPVSAALTLERFVLPLLDRLLLRRRAPATVQVRVTAELHPRRDAEVVVPLVLEAGDDGVPLGLPQSRRGGALSGLARAGALLRLPAGGDDVAAGSVVEAERI